jgi:hypothetical protein
MLDFAEAKLDVVEARVLAICLCVLPRQGEHIGGHVDANHPASRADLRPGQKDIEAAAASKVKDHLAGLQGGKRRRVATREAHVGPLGEDTQLRGLVADARGQRRDVEGLCAATT